MSSSSRLSLVHGSPGTEDSDHLSQDLPSTVQYNRQESSHSMTSSSRLQAYSDAIFSIIATVMSFESTFMTVLALLLVAYLLSFFVVSAAWAGHVWVFQTIAKADDVIVLLNLFTLYGLFANYFIPILVFCLSVILIGFLQALIVLYAFKYDSKILTADLNANPEKNKTKRGLLQVILTNPAICVVSLLLSAISYSLSHVAILLILFGQPLRKLVFSIYNKCKKCGQANMPHLEYIPDKYTQEKLSMERIEAFSDGVFAIVATLIILDICSSCK
uniref:Endosomal/lysosomal proton channel TMEM175 n=1 Tax=Saccoglossus kowalevskii TaxID=10224 RepID=A0ABM0MZF7_SACKO|nr:PREDICTED: transmembrane protein 175-like [Saccoglossus kowalevskii]